MTAPKTAACAVRDLEFAYRQENHKRPVALYRQFSLSIDRQRTLAIMGGSGSGKSTLAKLLAGILQSDSGTVQWDDEFIEPRNRVYIDQQPLNSVFPWQTVRRNIEFPLRKLRWSRSRSDERVEHLLDLFRLRHVADSWPARVSGGELQRVSLARCTSWYPKAIIVDEALSAQDRQTKEIIISALHRLAQDDGVTIILITHNLSDVMALADRCVVLGKAPVEVLTDVPIDLPFPRDESDPAYQSAQEPLIEILRHGLF